MTPERLPNCASEPQNQPKANVAVWKSAVASWSSSGRAVTDTSVRIRSPGCVPPSPSPPAQPLSNRAAEPVTTRDKAAARPKVFDIAPGFTKNHPFRGACAQAPLKPEDSISVPEWDRSRRRWVSSLGQPVARTDRTAAGRRRRRTPARRRGTRPAQARQPSHFAASTTTTPSASPLADRARRAGRRHRARPGSAGRRSNGRSA